MKVFALFLLASLAGLGIWYVQLSQPAEPTAVRLQGSLPPQISLTPTPRAHFSPTTRKGYYNIDAIGDFTLPATKTITFCGAGRNLHVQQDRSKLFRRGFTSIEQTRMIEGVEIWTNGMPPQNWHSSLQPSQRALILYQNYFADAFGLDWARNSEQARDMLYQNPPGARSNNRNTLYQASMELRGGCVSFGDCPPGDMKSTFSKIFLDIENEGTSLGNRQEQANLYTFMMKTLKENVSQKTEIGSIAPVPHNSFGNSRAEHYTAGPDWLWNMPARQTASSKQRGMPDAIVGKSYADYADFQMPGTYYLFPDFDYSASHTGDGDRHWLASLLAEQEVNRKLSPKKRIAWHWLFNTQSSDYPNSGKAEHPAPPAIAEGMGIFYWFTGAYGVLFWDDHKDLTPDQPSHTDSAQKGLGNDRNYACYEHYLHGLWRLFRHHGDLFNGRETYLNEATECSFDGGQSWLKYNANQLKTRNLPFVRAIVNGNQILIAATKAYDLPNQTSQVMVRYVENGYNFYTTLTLKGDEISLGRATMNRRVRQQG
ncbi:hypothetical protein HNV11_15665 [Spirosoma taeanense]|uniref:Uncharacterized protein n=1 Tax=Spirosoma taeanense TaxID=2735870 RepID=A0A6M5Y9T1_9BACT|nr:hypothetical protein [Spirosoma taeanense]QJW90715.1 hypothetical protein HNV11_15665 [Spirosoma taeanense]